MKETNMNGRMNWIIGVAAMGLMALTALPAQGLITGPYTADSDTLHLWHLDEADPGPALPAPGVTGSWNLTLNADLTAKGGVPTSGATLGNASYPGFGTALSTPLASSNADGGTQPVTAVTGASGAFTFEAIIKTSTITATTVQEIISMEGEFATTTTRPFQFVITTDGKLDFANVGGVSGVLSYLAPIPTTGPDAFVANQWFHVAVTYNGLANTANNLKLYWTRVDPSSTAADLLSNFQMVDSLTSTATGFFQVGNEGRGDTHNLLGSLDEVRISDIARTPDQFIFTTPEPASLGLLAAGSLLLLRRRRA